MKQYLGKTILYSVALAALDGQVIHGQVTELSPSGKYVMMDWQWFPIDKVSVLEVMPDKPQPPQLVPVPLPTVQTSEPPSGGAIAPAGAPASGNVTPLAPAPALAPAPVPAPAPEPAALNSSTAA